jgi:nitrite reductase (NO-forming)
MAEASRRSLPVVASVEREGACCEACAAAPVASTTAPRVIRRSDDRRITFVGLLVAGIWLALAAASAVMSIRSGGTAGWAAFHLALAGAAGTAVASVMPFFTTALAQVAPASPRIRVAAVALVAVGALAVTLGVPIGATGLAVGGGLAYLGGLAGTAVAAFGPLRFALGQRARLVLIAYAAALIQVAIGVGLATSMVAGWGPVVADWAALKPAHAWLNVFGFLSVVIAATLVHLAPTVAGTRMRDRRTATIAIAGLVAGSALVAIGFGGGLDAVGRVGAIVELVGAAALLAHAIGVRRDRGRWTSDPGWHQVTGLSLLAAPWWFLVAVAIAAGRVLWLGPVSGAWSMDLLAVPLILGWTAQVLIGSWTHLVPAIGPGDQATHATQRRRLGRWGTARVVSWNVGVAVATVGLILGSMPAAAIGGATVAIDLVIALGLLVGSIPRSGLPHVRPVVSPS